MRIKKTLANMVRGSVLGIGVGYIIAVNISSATGSFAPAPASLVDEVGMLQASQMLLGYGAILGAVFAGTRFVFEKPDWSLFKATLVYFTVNLAVMLFAGSRMQWFVLTLSSVAAFLGIYIAIFFAIWIVMYNIKKKEAMRLNEGLKDRVG